MLKSKGETPSHRANSPRNVTRWSRPVHKICSPGNKTCLPDARAVSSIGRPIALTIGKKKRTAKKYPNATLRCHCGHPKSIHSRMYANPKLGTSCNFPFCRCKAYKLG